MSKYLFQLNHPAHYHLFKNSIQKLLSNGHKVFISIKDKDILKELVQGYPHVQISNGYRNNDLLSIISSLFQRDYKLLSITKKFKPNLMIGTSPEIGHVSVINRIPTLFMGEDDVDLSYAMYLGALSCYPLFNTILSPKGVNNSIWNKKTINYDGFQKLAYLHPNYFKPDRSKVDIPLYTPYYLIRFSNLNAYHDKRAVGISNTLAISIVKQLSEKGNVLISSERELPSVIKQYEFKGNKNDIHHYLYYASLFIGDSQSMAVESAILGTPNIRYSSFIGKISVLEEIQEKYQLSIGIRSDYPNILLDTINKLINNDEIQTIYKKRREQLINDKIDVTSFFVWFIENYPNSAKIMKENPEYQYKFK
jgi:uncharacterized protein